MPLTAGEISTLESIQGRGNKNGETKLETKSEMNLHEYSKRIRW